MYQDDIDRFDEATYPLPPSCLISVYGSPDAVPTLHYSIPLEGVADPVTLLIDRKLQLESKLLESLFVFLRKIFLIIAHIASASMQKLHESLEKQDMLPEGILHWL